VSDTPKLPIFEDPPLIEVVHGIQFEPLGLSIVHPGQFYDEIADRYAKVEAHPPLMPVQELFGSAAIGQPGFRFEVAPPAEMPRAWFISSDNAYIAQIQRDRLLLNWRFVQGGAAYPHYQGMRSKFDELYLRLERFAQVKHLGAIIPTQIEITYISHIVTDQEANLVPDPARYFRIFSGICGPEWSYPMEALKLEAKFLLRGEGNEPIGRLYAVLTTFEKGGSNILQLELTARGAPEVPDQPGVARFLNFAHDQIFNCFTGMTTPEAHVAWGRR
jgi:uncharacterized protein (TIGR04255 family)